jgi:ATP-binding cassette subfamily B protein
MTAPSQEHTSPATQPHRTWSQRWQEIHTALLNIPRAAALVWDAHRWGTLGLGILTLVAAALPASQAWVGKLIVDSIVYTISEPQPASTGLHTIVPLLILGFVLITASAIIQQSMTLLEHVVNSHLSHTINEAIIRKALALDMRYFDDAEFYNKLQNARREADYRALAVVNTLFSFAQGIIILASFGAILLTLSPLVVLILVGATIPSFIAQAHYGSLYFRLLLWRTPEFRRMQYLEYLLTVDSNVKEIKLFGLGIPLLTRYQDMFWSFYREDVTLARRRSLISILWGMLSSGSFYATYAWIAWRAMTGAITLGDLTLYLTMFLQTQSTFRGLLSNIGQLYEHGLFLENLFSYLKLEPQMKSDQKSIPIPHPIMQGITFRNVSFHYPGYDTLTLHNVNLHIRPGETLALVGANGAGKTTLIKLLTRLYDPTEGEILLDGIDLRDYHIDDLRQCIGVIFQDFVHYQATARDNIGFGQISELDNHERIAAASQHSGASDVVANLPDGYDTMLGHWFAGGHELSGGEWQKIALGRAFMRDSEVLVLDEPTASLDVEHEHAIFEHFRDITRNKTAILISHRFSTVRIADRIAVIENGTIAELGTHEELLAQGRLYARLFQMQAQKYC